MFDTSKVEETQGLTPMKPGIRENISMTEVKHEALTEGNSPVLFTVFEDEYGGQHREIFWELDAERIKGWNDGTKTHNRNNPEYGFVKGEVITPEESVILEQINWLQRLKHIATKFVSEQELNEATKGVATYADFADAYVELLSADVREATKVRLKVTLNKKGFTQLPKYPPFIESMDVPKEASTLQITDYDRVSVPTVASADDPTDFNPESFDPIEEDAGF